eukprot:COSAG01_NODE_16418_length_1237_cov_2.394552_2_plen_49_part_01
MWYAQSGNCARPDLVAAATEEAGAWALGGAMVVGGILGAPILGALAGAG